MWGTEHQDARAELHRDSCPDAEGPYEVLYCWQDALTSAKVGEDIPPWLTQDEAVVQAEEHIERLQEELGL